MTNRKKRFLEDMENAKEIHIKIAVDNDEFGYSEETIMIEEPYIFNKRTFYTDMYNDKLQHKMNQDVRILDWKVIR